MRRYLNRGVTIAFGENAGLGVYDEGELSVIGTEGDPVIFRGLQDVQGYWRGIHTQTDNSANLLWHVDLRNAGSNYVYCCNEPAGLYVKGGQMRVQDSRITDNGGCGIYYGVSATLVQTGNSFGNNAAGDICTD